MNCKNALACTAVLISLFNTASANEAVDESAACVAEAQPVAVEEESALFRKQQIQAPALM